LLILLKEKHEELQYLQEQLGMDQDNILGQFKQLKNENHELLRNANSMSENVHYVAEKAQKYKVDNSKLKEEIQLLQEELDKLKGLEKSN
jgi:regulator of replication initiation timing